MVVTVTLNPAIDKTYTVCKLMPGQVNRMVTVEQFPGGKGINVSRVLQQFGIENTAAGLLGGYTGRFIEEALEEQGIPCRFIKTSEATRCNTNIIDELGYVTEILEPGPTLRKEELDAFIKEYRMLCSVADLIILSGSAARGIPTDIYAALTEIASVEGKKVLLDTSGEYLIRGIEVPPFLVKPNLKELEHICAEKLKYQEQIVEAAVILQRRGVERVVVSMGENGLIYVDGESCLKVKPPKITVANTVGCGDSVVAALTMSILACESTEEMLRRAVAVSAANATTLENGRIPMDKWESYMDRIVVERI